MVLGPASKFITGGFKDWNLLPREWLEYMTYGRDGTGAMEMAWRYKQAYDALKANIN